MNVKSSAYNANSIYNGRLLYQDFNRNHLSDLFNSRNIKNYHDYSSMGENHFYFSEKFNKMKEEMTDLKRERFGLKETLKELDTKFNQGIITAVEYFRTFRNLKKQFYSIEKQIDILDKKLREEESIRKVGKNKRKHFY